MNKLAIISGTSGLIGMQLLHELLKGSTYDTVISVGRRTLALKHDKLIQLEVDFKEIINLDWESKLRDADLGGIVFPIVQAIKDKKVDIHAFCALGTTIKAAGSKEKFYMVDHDFVFNFAKWVFELGAKRFMYVSAMSANPQSKIYYNSVKGEIEEDLKVIHFDYLGIFQPSLLLGSRSEFRLGEEVAKILSKPISWLKILNSIRPIYDYKVAKAMIFHANEAKNVKVEVVQSKEMQAF
ncbi:NAD-dependent epimerase/dehydratase family protein [Belliella sp. R4-6]|uniref:NAD-dependent epimerase/dehydratase family protein n=1 Tax=Belliella alkalica TaxID=1730871 RepID=A0ABS9V6G8_9BACT|nr:NAD-dependent epimerase/dehydratase family protein [Belliella alkalica]MCH7412008.1 NAD-dependent epimerase/dehydratase family protein [Belliella alkalica]